MPSDNQCSRDGIRSPRALSPMRIRLPAVVHRSPLIRNGGILSSVTRIARYVVPHTKHKKTQAA